MTSRFRAATIAAHAAGAIDQASGGIVPPLQTATTYLRDESYALVQPQNIYLRPDNESVRIAERVIAELEEAEECLLFPSGMAAIAALFRSLPTGARVVMQSGIYYGSTHWSRGFCARRGITLIEADTSDLEQFATACDKGVDLVFIETPSNPWLKTTDIAAVATIAHQAGALLAVDSTAASPVLTKPLTLGADIVVHSATKVLNGHSDLLGGVLACREISKHWQAIREDRSEAGAVMGAFEAWLLVRSLRTLPLRVEKMCVNAMKVAEFLSDHPAVQSVFYPGLESHPGHEIAAQQMQGGFGYLLSVVLKGDASDALAAAGRLQVFLRATSLGGVESLVEHRHTIEPNSGIPETLLRLSVGIEDCTDLIEDLAQALGQ